MTDEQMQSIDLSRHELRGGWNYTIYPTSVSYESQICHSFRGRPSGYYAGRVTSELTIHHRSGSYSAPW